MRALVFVFFLVAVVVADDGAEAASSAKKKGSGNPMDFLPPEVAAKIQGIKSAAFEQGAGPEGFIENCQAFYAAVDFTEMWIQGLLVFHVVLLILVLCTRQVFELQCFFFMVICGLVFFAENLNSYAATHWKEFSKQNYFDKRGVFTSVMLCAPLLTIGFVLMISTLLTSADLLIKVKREELKVKMRSDKEEADGKGAGATASKAGKSSKKKGKKKDE